ncbi:hypothetical protein LINGRAHAP2_LOCUS25779 [Linum grandiflorum]
MESLTWRTSYPSVSTNPLRHPLPRSCSQSCTTFTGADSALGRGHGQTAKTTASS